MLTNDDKIRQRVALHYEAACREYGEDHILGVFAYGSMNYGLWDAATSDVDTKAIYIPSMAEAVLRHNRVSNAIKLEGGEYCEVKDIREMVEMWKKQNINFVEILFTEYNIINPKFQNNWDDILVWKNDIARYDTRQCLHSIARQALHTIQQAKNLDSRSKEYGKKAANILRLHYFVNSLLKTCSYKECIRPNISVLGRLMEVKKCSGVVRDYTLDDEANYFTGILNTDFRVDNERKNWVDVNLDRLTFETIQNQGGTLDYDEINLC